MDRITGFGQRIGALTDLPAGILKTPSKIPDEWFEWLFVESVRSAEPGTSFELCGFVEQVFVRWGRSFDRQDWWVAYREQDQVP